MSKSVMLLLSVTLLIGVTHANHGKHSHHHDHGHDHGHDHAEVPAAAAPVEASFPGGSFFQVRKFQGFL